MTGFWDQREEMSNGSQHIQEEHPVLRYLWKRWMGVRNSCLHYSFNPKSADHPFLWPYVFRLYNKNGAWKVKNCTIYTLEYGLRVYMLGYPVTVQIQITSCKHNNRNQNDIHNLTFFKKNFFHNLAFKSRYPFPKILL